MIRTRTTSVTLLRTGVEHTSAAHLVVDDESLTVIWSSIPAACSDWVRGDVASMGPVHYPADRVPDVWKSSNSTYCAWQPITETQCGVCGQMVGPWAVVRDGHLEGDELTEAAREIAELADEERESQRTKLIADLADDAEDVASRLADGSIERTELPDLEAMSDPGVGVRGDEVVAWSTLPDLDGGDDPEIVEVARPIPTGPTSLA